MSPRESAGFLSCLFSECTYSLFGLNSYGSKLSAAACSVFVLYGRRWLSETCTVDFLTVDEFTDHCLNLVNQMSSNRSWGFYHKATSSNRHPPIERLRETRVADIESRRQEEEFFGSRSWEEWFREETAPRGCCSSMRNQIDRLK